MSKCDKCEGTGKVYDDYVLLTKVDCEACLGTGIEPEDE